MIGLVGSREAVSVGPSVGVLVGIAMFIPVGNREGVLVGASGGISVIGLVEN